MNLDLGSLQIKARGYNQVLQNTLQYRAAWKSEIKPMLMDTLNFILKNIEIKGEVKEQTNIENLEAVIVDLGKVSSGISENFENTGVKRTMIKINGALLYQQLFNGKVMVMIVSPHIEGYGEPKPARTLEILRPDELKQPFLIRHFEALLKDVTEWEDFDDDQPSKSTIGFNPSGYISNEDAPIKS